MKITREDLELIEQFHRVKKEFHNRNVHFFEKLGLPYGQPPILFALCARDGQTQTELCRAVRLTPATMTAAVRRMEAAGWIRREADVVDSRNMRVFITDKSRRFLEEHREKMDSFQLAIFEGFSEAEKLLLRRFLVQIEQNMANAPENDSDANDLRAGD